jgi:hypothetical protein
VIPHASTRSPDRQDPFEDYSDAEEAEVRDILGLNSAFKQDPLDDDMDAEEVEVREILGLHRYRLNSHVKYSDN